MNLAAPAAGRATTWSQAVRIAVEGRLRYRARTPALAASRWPPQNAVAKDVPERDDLSPDARPAGTALSRSHSAFGVPGYE
jgi:hypothetical protein